MEPKFQSSFIPKGPIATSGPVVVQKKTHRSIFTFVSGLIFTLSVILAVGVFTYKLYLGYRIGQMSSDLADAQTELAPETVKQFTRLNDRITSTGDLLVQHRLLSPLLEYLENFTLKAVRFTDFQYVDGPKGIELSMNGQARGYSALALQADIFNKNESLEDAVFSDLNLNEAGNVIFAFHTTVNPMLLSFKKSVEMTPVSDPSAALKTPSVPVVTATTSTTTSTSSGQATSTSQ